MTKLEKTLWGCELSIEVQYDCFDDEEILPAQEEALNNLLEKWASVEDSLSAVKTYCAEQSAGQLEPEEIDNIFKYVVPKALFVLRAPENEVALMCDFRFDLEHGLAIIFQNGELVGIDDQDSVL